MLHWNAEQVSLARQIGAGRQATVSDVGLRLGFAALGGTGVRLTIRIDGVERHVWIDETSFCRWLAPKLDVPNFAAYPADLAAVLASWCVSPLIDFAAGVFASHCEFVAARPAVCESDYGPVLWLRRDDAQLPMRLLDWPQAVLGGLADAMTPGGSTDEAVRVALPVSLVAGWVSLEREQWRTLRSGDGIVFDAQADIAGGEAWLFNGHPLARLRTDGVDWQVTQLFDGTQPQESMTDPSEAHAEDIIVADQPDARFTVIAEVATITLSLEELATLTPGAVLDGGLAFDGKVRLKANGRTLAQGHLVSVQGRLLARIG